MQPFQSQTTVIKSQQNRIENNNNLINKMKTDLTLSSSDLKTLKGEYDNNNLHCVFSNHNLICLFVASEACAMHY